MKKVFLFLTVAFLALLACNKQDDVINIEKGNYQVLSQKPEKFSIKASGYWTGFKYRVEWRASGKYGIIGSCDDPGTNCSKWVSTANLIESLDYAIQAGPNEMALFFENEIDGTELESLKNDREIYAKFISGELYAQKINSDENCIYRFYEIINGNEVDFLYIELLQN